MKKIDFGSFLSRLDIFGAQVNIGVNGKNSFKTKFGGLVSLAFLSVSLLSAGFSAYILV